MSDPVTDAAEAYQLARHPDDGHKHSFGCRFCGVDAQPAIDVEALRECLVERDDCRHGRWEALGGDHFAEHVRAALERSRP